MSQQQIKRDDIRVFFKSTFERVGYSQVRTGRFCKTAERLHDYMAAINAEFYTPTIGKTFIQLEQRSVEDIGSRILKTDRRAIDVMNMVLAGKPITFQQKRVVRPLPGEIGNAAQVFLKHLEENVRSAPNSLRRYVCVLSPFSIYCKMKGLTLQNIDYRGIVGYIASMQNADSKTTSVLRIFFRYLYNIEILKKDYSLEIANIQPRRREKIPSFYGKDEILMIEQSIERTCPKGKRAYAIVKLASRLGLRASDIAGLEFSNMVWENNTVRLKQKKTGKIIELPLLADVGNAIIDYVKNGRPQSEHKNIFLSYTSPHRPMTSNSVSNMISKIIIEAGIDINGRKHGPHSLRHSLAYNMLSNGETLGTISNALGHSGVESTMFYMGVDIDKLLECSHPVPSVDPAFYNQRGGLLYD